MIRQTHYSQTLAFRCARINVKAESKAHEPATITLDGGGELTMVEAINLAREILTAVAIAAQLGRENASITAP